MSESETTVLVGFKVRGYAGPRCFLVGHVMAGLKRVGVDCFEAWGVKDRTPELRALTEERNAIMLENHRLRCGRSTAHATEDVSIDELLDDLGARLR